MADDPLAAALERLDRAVSRVEAAGSLVQPPSGDLAASYAALDERHDLLRLRIQETIERLDVLIAGPTSGSPA